MIFLSICNLILRHLKSLSEFGEIYYSIIIFHKYYFVAMGWTRLQIPLLEDLEGHQSNVMEQKVFISGGISNVSQGGNVNGYKKARVLNLSTKEVVDLPSGVQQGFYRHATCFAPRKRYMITGGCNSKPDVVFLMHTGWYWRME